MTRAEQIHAKGFDMTGCCDYRAIGAENEFKRIKVGVKQLDDAVLNLGSIKNSMPGHGYTNKGFIMKALVNNDVAELRAISNFYYNLNGVYERVCNYFAYLYRYDWYVAPEINDDSVKEEKILKDFSKVLNFLDNSYIKKVCGDIALSVIKNGCYYGYVVPSSDGVILQDLPIAYCRSRYQVAGMPAVEFNMKFFDTFRDINYRMRVLNLFPDEFKKGYLLYKQGKLLPDYQGDNDGSWYLLDPENTVKFNYNGSDVPAFVNAIPALLDLDAAQDLDRRKQMQKLLKIIVQKLPLDKNGDLIFDVDEARDIHNNGVNMLKRAIGVDVLTTFTDVQSIDLSDKNTSTSVDDLEKVERAVFNAFGISQNLFNTDGNLSLEKSILNDESSMRNLLIQFSMFFSRITKKKFSSGKKYSFNFYMLETTQYNYKELSKMYKEQTQLGYSKMLPQIALGHSQSFILNTAHFENEVLHLSEIMIPPLMSSTMSSEDVLGKSNQTGQSKSQNNSGSSTKSVGTSEKSAGRPEKADGEKSEKTIKNKESMS